MRARTSRHLGALLTDRAAGVAAFADDVDAAEAAAFAAAVQVPPTEVEGRDYAIFLLRVAAEIEHSLMVQYLFAAYSLGGPAVPPEAQAGVRAWQETILGIAKEEMAHLVTVQNLLTALGGPVNLDREDYPHSSAFYPFGFTLRPAGLEALATYICAESPPGWDDAEAQEIRERARVASGEPVNRVGELYAELRRVLAGLPESDFNADTVAFQASWDEWGRGYREGQRGREAMGPLPELPAPELLIVEVASREAGVAALTRIGEQGEAFDTPTDDDESHFRRFLAIYRGMLALGGDLARVVRPVVTNPSTVAEETGDPTDPDTATTITDTGALLWAHLFNVRYRKLLVSLAHAFELADDPDRTTVGARGALIHRSFGEMYHLRTIAGQLVRLPADAAAPDGPRAAPPFQMPYSLMLPRTERDRWRLHRDILDASRGLVDRLKELGGSGDGPDYLLALAQADDVERGQVQRLIAVSSTPGGGTP